jgi:hypothetical protein
MIHSIVLTLLKKTVESSDRFKTIFSKVMH